MWDLVIYPLLGAAALAAAIYAGRRWRGRRRIARLAQIRRDFHHCRERLEHTFLELASTSGKPRGLQWKDCEFADEVVFARDRNRGEICALVGVTISFEAIIGGPMEDVAAVGNLRAATAVFRLDGERWRTEGRALFNLSPHDALNYYRDSMEQVVFQEV